MPLRYCDFPSCESPAERGSGDCMICSSHRCLKHLAPESHTCPSEDNDPDAFHKAYDSARKRHLQTLLDKIESDSYPRRHFLLHTALPNGLEKATEDLAESEQVTNQTGGQNCNIDICFDDGIVWIARLRFDEPTVLPREAQSAILKSEVATLKFLADKTKIRVPKVFDYSYNDENEIGTPYILMEKLPGKPLEWSEASAEQKSKIMEQLVDAYLELELEKNSFSETGSLSEGGLVGPFAQGHMFVSPSESLGPFSTLEASLKSILEHEIDMIIGGELATLATDNYLTHSWRLEHLPSLLASASDDKFYLKHGEDKGDHILIDKDYNITGIIDWEFATIETRKSAFSSPCMMWPVSEYYDGSNVLSPEECEFAQMFQRRGREDMAQMILQGRSWQRFLFFLGSAEPPPYDDFSNLFQGLRRSIEGENIISYSEWRRLASDANGTSLMALQDNSRS
ncbi:hypothetical protein E4T52_15377 [Aureobasidium sp. EXF-3400]|nr:hypothetical protein E4T51_15238 [Aureobasidium sp. EXF-12344]KAI4769582.1 hypothetical protein E4T52_15377 [Aureobasidium sp. EXF-3400]